MRVVFTLILCLFFLGQNCKANDLEKDTLIVGFTSAAPFIVTDGEEPTERLPWISVAGHLSPGCRRPSAIRLPVPPTRLPYSPHGPPVPDRAQGQWLLGGDTDTGWYPGLVRSSASSVRLAPH